MTEKCPKTSKVMSSDVSFCPTNNLKPRNIQFTIRYEKGKATNPHI